MSPKGATRCPTNHPGLRRREVVRRQKGLVVADFTARGIERPRTAIRKTPEFILCLSYRDITRLIDIELTGARCIYAVER